MNRPNPLSICAAATMALLAACATIGNPEGGPRDTTPPRVVRSNPPAGSLNYKGKRITVTLNKNVQLDDAFNKVIISPAQAQAPVISSNARNVTVEFRDTLMANTTYTIDFADAIKDLNEGNILDGYATDFSTGDTLDTLRISGIVLEARTLEPAQGMIVGAHRNLSDTAFTTLPLERVTKTNARGEFTLRNLKEGEYRLFALGDINRDYKWDRTEDMAYTTLPVTPYVEQVTVVDTLRTADGKSDSVAARRVPIYLPNDVLLTWFNENYRAQYIQDHARPDRNRLQLTLGAPTDTLPRLRVAEAPDSLAHLVGLDLTSRPGGVVDVSATLDTIEVWMLPAELRALDTLRVEVSVLMPDSLEQLRWSADTLNFIYREPKRSKRDIQAQEAKAKREAEERQALADSLGVPVDSLPPPPAAVTPLQLTLEGGPRQDLNRQLRLSFNEPPDTFNLTALTMEVKVDTLWQTVEAPRFHLVSDGRPLTYEAEYAFSPGTAYRLTADSLAAVSVYGHVSNKAVREFTTASLDDYGVIYFNVSGVPDSVGAVVELLNGQDQPVRREPVDGGRATFRYLTPGDYFARLFIDTNGDGEWTTGHYSAGSQQRQPEDVYYFPKKISLKRNWEVEQPWNIDQLPVDQQKPFEIKKNKPKDAKAPAVEPEEDSPAPPGLE